MNLTMHRYEMRCSDDNNWVPISVKDIFENLSADFDYVYSLIDNLLQGKEILIQGSVYRMKRIKADTSLDYLAVI